MDTSEKGGAPTEPPSHTPRIEPVLAASGIRVQFGGLTALSDVDIEVGEGSIAGLVGPNGAGKSTLLAVLSGFLRPNAGRVYLDGVDVTSLSAQARGQRGLARTFQQPEVFGGLTVREHIVLAYRARHSRRRMIADAYSLGSLRPPSAAEVERVDSLVDLLSLAEFADRDVLGVPLGVARLMEVARALATDPRVVLLDEPSSGLDHHETQRLTAALARVVAEHKISIVLVEHDIEMVLGLSSRVFVLDFGLRIAAGSSAQIRADPAVQMAFLGEETGDDNAPRAEPGPAASAQAPLEPLLTVEGLTVQYGQARALTDFSLEVGKGMAVAVLGANGAGKSTLGRALSGLLPVTAGRIRFADEMISDWPAHRIRRLGLAYLPEERGVFRGLSVIENLKMAVSSLPRSDRQGAIDRVVELFPILGQRQRQVVASLSGGEQQMISLARALALQARLIIADEMSLGLAPRVVDSMFDGLNQARKAGVAILLIEQFVERALDFADRCLILRSGEVCWSGRTAEAGQEVLDHYLGADAPSR
jgi:branched-chain amino acid transport system ATP-binding protein